MRNRRRSREMALQALFYMDMSQEKSIDTLELFCKTFKPAPKSADFFMVLVKGVFANQKTIDALIESFSSNWKVSRMPCVDRNILRIATYELLFLEDIPAKVAINEAIDIGKKFGTEESGAFINGILDTIHLAQKNEEIPIDSS